MNPMMGGEEGVGAQSHERGRGQDCGSEDKNRIQKRRGRREEGNSWEEVKIETEVRQRRGKRS